MKPIPVSEPKMSGNELDLLRQCTESGWLSSEGKFVFEFEDKFSNLANRRYGIAVSSGSAALDVAVAALGLGPGDEVIVPAFCIISCVASIVRAGATPVLVDCDPNTWNADIEGIESVLSSKTKAVLIVHTYGLPVDLDPILSLAKEKGLYIIEDAAEMHGQTYRGKPCGSFGDISTFSFYSNKNITTGEGGMLVTDDAELAEKCKGLRNLCFNSKARFVHECLGWNYRMTNLQAAVGVVQIDQLESVIQRKRQIGASYQMLLCDIEEIQLPMTGTSYAANIYWIFGIVLSVDHRFSAKDVSERLAREKIGSRPFFWPMHKQPVFEKKGLFGGESHPVSEHLATHGFYIPCGPRLEDSQIRRVSDVLHEILA